MALNAIGRQRAKEHQLPLFIDGSCRREPDLQLKYPAISALCRTSQFAPRLDVGHSIVYCAQKAPYTGNAAFWCLVAMLRVEHRFKNHQEAAEWYLTHEGKLPSNCMVPGNAPDQFDKTLGFPDPKNKGEFNQNDRLLSIWDAGYKQRAIANPVFLACSTVEISLDDPVIITDGVKAALPSQILPNSRLGKFEITQADWNWFRNLFQTGLRLSQLTTTSKVFANPLKDSGTKT